MTAPTLPKTPTPANDWASLEDGSFDVPAHEWSRSQAGTTPAPRTDAFARTDVASGLSLGARASTVENRNQVAQFRCDACRGSGRFVRGYHNPVDYGPCNKCKGTGKLKTDPETRAKQKKAREDKKQAAVGAYISEHVAEYTWAMSNLRFDFARSMCEAVKQHGSWTEGQLTAIRKCMARDAERDKEREATKAAAPVITGEGFDRMLATFARAKASGLRYPKLRIGEFTFALAGERSKYAGKALFVKNGDNYCGRIDLEGRWFSAPGCTEGEQQRIKEICRDPLAAAVLHGKQTGNCACCGLELTNEESVRLGIGPICREKWGL